MGGTVRLRGEGGAVWAFDLPLGKELQKKVDKGQLQPADDDARQLLAPFEVVEEPKDSDGGTDDGPGTGNVGEDPSRPAETAAKPEWVAYARSRGIDTDGLTKPKLVEAVDQLDS